MTASTPSRFSEAGRIGLALLLLAACNPSAASEPDQASKRTQRASPVEVPAEIRDFRSPREQPGSPLPQRLRIPSLRVDTALERLSVDRDRTIEVPKDWQRAGWYANGARPGEPGAAVLLGHVDSPFGPAVFTRLPAVRRGAKVLVDRADGSTVVFRVTRVEEHRRAKFPAVDVYWPTLQRELRLITCGGPYVRAAGGYQSNVIVFATAEEPGPAAN